MLSTFLYGHSQFLTLMVWNGMEYAEKFWRTYLVKLGKTDLLFSNVLTSGPGYVLLLDGSSEQVAHLSNLLLKIYTKFDTAVNVNKCLKKVYV